MGRLLQSRYLRRVAPCAITVSGLPANCATLSSMYTPVVKGGHVGEGTNSSGLEGYDIVQDKNSSLYVEAMCIFRNLEKN